MGGFHTLYIAANHPDSFNYIGLFSAGLDMSSVNQSLPTYQNLDGKLKALQKDGCKLFWMGIGCGDFLYQANQDFRKRLDGIGFKYEYHESGGEHQWANWRQYMLLFVPRLFK